MSNNNKGGGGGSFDLNGEVLNRIKNLDDETLGKAIKSLVEGSGGNERQLRRALSNLDFIRKKIASMSEEDIKKAIGSVDKDKAAEIADIIKSSNK